MRRFLKTLWTMKATEIAGAFELCLALAYFVAALGDPWLLFTGTCCLVSGAVLMNLD